jgi:predicted DNA-binding WGR domain protein
MTTRRFEFDDGKSRKFWEIELDGCWHIVRYGRIGTTGRTVEKIFFTPPEAKAAHDKLISQKTVNRF